MDLELRDFVLGGVALEGEARDRFNAIQQELSALSTKFSNNVLDATKAFKRLVTDRAEVAGLPPSALAGAAQAAAGEPGSEAATPEDGPWLFTLDFPSYFPVMTHAENRALREELYRANITRASAGALDNTPVIERTLELRREKAALLGYASYAELSMASKMATLGEAQALLEQLRAAARPAAEADLRDVQAFAAGRGFQGDLAHWDVTFWAERLKEDKYSISDEELRPFFALPNVLEGLFKVSLVSGEEGVLGRKKGEMSEAEGRGLGTNPRDCVRPPLDPAPRSCSLDGNAVQLACVHVLLLPLCYPKETATANHESHALQHIDCSWPTACLE